MKMSFFMLAVEKLAPLCKLGQKRFIGFILSFHYMLPVG